MPEIHLVQRFCYCIKPDVPHGHAVHPLCCSSDFDQIMPCLYCPVQNQKQGSTASHRASDQIMESVYNSFT